MGRGKIQVGTPCKRGHPYSFRTGRGCEACRRLRKKEYRKRHGQKRRAYLAEANAEWLPDYAKRLRQRAGSGEPRASVRQLFDLLVGQQGRCAITGLPFGNVRPSLDHVVPLSRGGTNGADNLQWVHPRANSLKGAGTDDEARTWVLAAAAAIQRRAQIADLL